MTIPESIEAMFVAAISGNEVIASLIGEGEEARIYAASSLGEGQTLEHNPPAPAFPYIVYNELPSTPYAVVEETSNAQDRFFNFYVYDEAGSMQTINLILRLIRKEIKGLPHIYTEDGDRLIGVRWFGFSAPVSDRDYHAMTRYGTARLATRY